VDDSECGSLVVAVVVASLPRCCCRVLSASEPAEHEKINLTTRKMAVIACCCKCRCMYLYALLLPLLLFLIAVVVVAAAVVVGAMLLLAVAAAAAEAIKLLVEGIKGVGLYKYLLP